MAELVGVLFLGLATWATLIALLTSLSLLVPGLAGHTARTLTAMPGRSFVLGAVNFLFLLVVSSVLTLIGNGLGGFLGGLFSLAALAVVMLILTLWLVGLTGLTVLMGRRLSGPEAATTTGQNMKAAALLVAGGLAPFVGWFILTPLTLLTGLGASLIALVLWIRQWLQDRK